MKRIVIEFDKNDKAFYQNDILKLLVSCNPKGPLDPKSFEGNFCEHLRTRKFKNFVFYSGTKLFIFLFYSFHRIIIFIVYNKQTHRKLILL